MGIKQASSIAFFHAAAMLSPRRTKAFFFARLNSFSSFSLRGWTGKVFCVYAKPPVRDKSVLHLLPSMKIYVFAGTCF